MSKVVVKFKNGSEQTFGPDQGVLWDADDWMDILSIKRVVHGVPDTRAYKQFSMHEVAEYRVE